MSSAPPPPIIKMNQIIRDIRYLRVDRDRASKVNSEKAERLQSVIFRKFAMIDFLESTSQQTVEMQRLKESVLKEKKAAQAEEADLKKMAIPRLERCGRKKARNNDLFELFTYLPPELQTQILEKLTSVRDKVNAAEAMPNAVLPVDWYVPLLKLEQVLPILLKQNFLELADLIRLARVSDSIRKLIVTHFESNLKDTCFNPWTTSVLDIPRLLKKTKSDGALCPNPIPTCISLSFSTDTRSASELEQMELLLKFGLNIWDLTLQINEASNRPALELICNCLGLVPNLKRLHLHFEPVAFHPEAFNNDGINLSDLPNLEILCVRGCDYIHGAIGHVVVKYAAQLKIFKSKYAFPFFSLYPRPTTFSLPVLTVLDLEWPRRHDMSMTRFDFKGFTGAPLKSLSIKSGERFRYKHFRDLLTTVHKFSSTLEELKLDVYIDQGSSAVWMAYLSFPKVKSPAIKNYPGAGMLLLLFPALETLTVTFYKYFEPSEILGLSWNVEEMYESKMWKLFSNLKTIRIYKRVLENGTEKREENSVTRAQCLAYHKKNEEQAPQ